MTSRVSVLVLGFGFVEKLLYWTIVPNVPVSWLNAGAISVSGLATFFLCHAITYRAVPALGGFWVDRKPPRQVLLLGFLLELAGLGMLCLSSSIFLGVAAGVVVGIGGGLVNPAVQGVLGKRSLERGEKANFTHNYLLMNLGALCGPLLVWPLLADRILYAFPVALGLMLHVQSLPDFVQPRSAKVESGFLKSLAVVAKDSFFVQFLLLCTMFWGCYTMIFSSIPAIAKELHFSFEGNVWLAINAATILLAHFTFRRWLSRFASHWSAIFTGYLVAVLGMFVLGAAFNVYMLVLGVVVLSVAELIATPPVYDYINETAPVAMRTQYIGFIWVAGALGEGGGQALLGLASSPRAVCITMGALLLGVVLAYDRGRKRAMPTNHSKDKIA